MGRAKNTLNAADVSSTPIKVKYAVSYPSSSLSDYGIALLSGSNISYNVTMSSAQMASMNNYRVIRQLYYQNYLTGSLIGSASAWYPWWQSTAASGSGDATYYNLPTETTASVLIFAIPSYQFGEQVSKKSFILASTGVGSQYRIEDDGNGNLIDTLDNNKYVGNLFYAQGIAVITNQEYSTPLTVFDFLATQANDEIATQANDNIIT